MYQALTVCGPSFQTVLLASPIFYLTQENSSSCRLMRRLNKFSLHTRLFVVSQPSLDIHLPIYPSELTDGNLKSLGCSGFARHYYRNRYLLFFPQGTKMFQFPCLPLPALCIQASALRHDSQEVSPFGHLRFKA